MFFRWNFQRIFTFTVGRFSESWKSISLKYKFGLKFFSRNDFKFKFDDFLSDFLFALRFFSRKILAFTAGRFSSGIFVLVEVFHTENFSFEVGSFSLEENQFQILGKM